MNRTKTAAVFEGEKLEELLLVLAEDNIKAQRLDNPRTIQMFGEATLTAGRLIVRGVPLTVVTQALVRAVQLPEDIASDVVVGLSEMIRTITMTDAAGNHLTVAIKEQPHFSLEKDWMNQMRFVTTCMGAFHLRDYSKCAATAEEGLMTYSKAILYQLLVISLQRMNRHADSEAQGNRALAALTYARWHQMLMAVTLGKVDVTKVYATAGDEGQRCQVRFYEGVRFLTLGKQFEAKLSLAECLRCSTDLMEKPLAQLEFDSVK